MSWQYEVIDSLRDRLHTLESRTEVLDLEGKESPGTGFHHRRITEKLCRILVPADHPQEGQKGDLCRLPTEELGGNIL